MNTPIENKSIDVWQQAITPNKTRAVQEGTPAMAADSSSAWLQAISAPVAQATQIQDGNVKAAQSWLDTIAHGAKAPK